MSGESSRETFSVGRNVTGHIYQGAPDVSSEAFAPTTADQAAAVLVIINLRALGREVPEHLLELASPAPAEDDDAGDEQEEDRPLPAQRASQPWANNPRDLFGGWLGSYTASLVQVAEFSPEVSRVAPSWLTNLFFLERGQDRLRNEAVRQSAAMAAMHMMNSLMADVHRYISHVDWQRKQGVVELIDTTCVHLAAWLHGQGVPDEVFESFDRGASVMLTFEDGRAQAFVVRKDDQARLRKFDFTEEWRSARYAHPSGSSPSGEAEKHVNIDLRQSRDREER